MILGRRTHVTRRLARQPVIRDVSRHKDDWGERLGQIESSNRDEDIGLVSQVTSSFGRQ